jgi:hypothetical protein
MWLAEIRPKVEKFAKIGGITITAAEVVGIVAAGVGIGKKIGSVVEKRRLDRGIAKILRGPNKEVVGPLRWVGTGYESPEFTREMVNIIGEVRNKYNLDDAQSARFGATIRHMFADAADEHTFYSTKAAWESVIRDARLRGPKFAKEKMLALFEHSYNDVLLEEGKLRGLRIPGNDLAHSVFKSEAKQLFERWENVQFPGLDLMMWVGQEGNNSISGVDSLVRSVKKLGSKLAPGQVTELVEKVFLHDATDFESVKPLSFDTILALYQAAPVDTKLLHEMAEDPKWGPVLANMPGVPEKVIAYDTGLIAAQEKAERQVRKRFADEADVGKKVGKLRERLRIRRIHTIAENTRQRVHDVVARVDNNPAVRRTRQRATDTLLADSVPPVPQPPTQQEVWDFQAMRMRAKQEMDMDLDHRQRLTESIARGTAARIARENQHMMAEAVIAPLREERTDTARHIARLVTQGSVIDPALAIRNPALVAEIAGQVANLGTNETTVTRELTGLLVQIGEHRAQYQPLIERLTAVADNPSSTEALQAAADLLERAYNSQKGVKKIDPFASTKFTTLGAFWMQRIGGAGLMQLLGY